MTCSFHPEDGDEYQLPMARRGSRPPGDRRIRGALSPFDIRELGATNEREDGTYLSTRRCWFRTRQSPVRRPGACTPVCWPTSRT
jgi:hypothetical protein